jgi:glutamine synthetase
MLAAGLEGIKHGYDLPDPVEHKKAGGELLPQSLGEAIQAAEHSKFLKDVLGEHILHSLIENKKMEWNEYCAEISDFERRKYLPVL